MKWDDPESRWWKNIEHALRLVPHSFSFRPFVTTAIPLLVLLSMTYFVASWRHTFLLLTVALLFFVFQHTGWFILQSRRLRKHVADSKGRVCPFCHSPMEVSDATRWVCPGCRYGDQSDRVVVYWEWWGLSRLVSLWRPTDDAVLPSRARRLLHAARHRSWLTLGAMTPFIFLLYLATLGPNATFVGGLLDIPIITFGMLLSIPLIVYGWTKRSALWGQRKCAQCAYDVAPVEPRSTHCPECDERWDLVGGTLVFGTGGAVSQAVRSYGCLAALFFLLLGFGSGSLDSRWIAPTDVLIAELEGNGVRWMQRDNVWQELTQRQLTDDQKRRIASHLWCDDVPSLRDRVWTWFDQELSNGSLPQDVIETYWQECVRPTMACNRDSDFPEQVYCWLEVQPAIEMPGTEMWMYLAGFEVDGKWHDRRTYPEELFSISWGPSEAEQALVRAGTVEGVPIDRTTTVRGVYWIVAHPSHPTPPLRWNPDGTLVPGPIRWQPNNTPVLIPGTLWAIRVESEATVPAVLTEAGTARSMTEDEAKAKTN